MPCVHFKDGTYLAGTVVCCRVEGCDSKIRVEVSGKDTERAANEEWNKVVSAAVELAGVLGWKNTDQCNLHGDEVIE